MNTKSKINPILFIFAAFYVVLLSYFAIEISASLPLLTVSRILILLLMGYLLACNGFKIKRRISTNRIVNKRFCVFIILFMLANLTHISSIETIKELFSFVHSKHLSIPHILLFLFC